ncbi:MAG: restriction endonuclease subunit S [Pseudomonadota bacterium]|nr:restriction endonuclease subunit S [Pseudomonadota bacterium]MEE3321203.1 restriction endonuclease subunit S [Pseudomonadota bacterium]
MIMEQAQKGKWELVTLGDITDIASGAGFPTRFQGNESGDYPFYKVSDMNLAGNETWMKYHNNAIDEGVRCEIKAKAYPKGTIIFPKIGAAIATNKKRILSRDSCFDNNVIGILPSEYLDTGYLYHLLLCKDLSDFANTGNPPSIRKTTLEQWKVPLPALEEQKRIAKILNAADALRAKRRESLAQLDALLQSTFLDLFGDPVENPRRWDEVPLEEIVSDSKIGLVRSSKEFGWDYTLPYVRMDAVSKDGKFLADKVQFTEASQKEIESSSLRPGDFLFNTRNSKELVGKSCIYTGPEGWLFNNNLMRIRFIDSVCPEVVAAQFHFSRVSRELDQRKSGTTNVFAVYWKNLKSLPVLVPPKELQIKYAAIVRSVNKQSDQLSRHLGELDNLFISLQQKAFSGEL